MDQGSRRFRSRLPAALSLAIAALVAAGGVAWLRSHPTPPVASASRDDTAAALARLAPSTCSVLWGVFETNTPWDDSMAAIRRLDTALQRHSAIVHWYAQWGSVSGIFRANQPRLLQNTRRYSSVGRTGSIPLITWEPWGPDFSPTSHDFPLTAIARGKFDDYVDSWARALRDEGGPVMLDFGHEMNGNWYPWGYGVNGNTPAQYVAAFRHVRDRFVAAGATNVRFLWNPDAWSRSGISAAAFYPGDAYVDWMAIDVYNWDESWTTLTHELRTVYGQLIGLNNSKPIILAEVGSQDEPPLGASPADKPAWIRLAAAEIPLSFPRVKAVIWFNREKSQLALDSSPGVLAAARQAFGSPPYCVASIDG